jgi:hypothetical protein
MPRVRAARLEQSVGHLSAADATAEAAEFARGLETIRAWAAAHGRTDLPQGYLDESGFPLAFWVAAQREAHLEDRLAPDRRDALESIPGWQWAPGAPGHSWRRQA